MEKKCTTCKWYCNKKCNCKDTTESLEAELSGGDGITYVEQGHLNEALKENMASEGIIKLVIKTLKEQDYIKKNKNIEKLDSDTLEDEIRECIDECLSKSIMNYFDDSTSDINVADPENFYCCNWI